MKKYSLSFILIILSITVFAGLYMNPVLTPTGTVLFESGGDIFEVPYEGGQAIAVAVSPYIDANPIVSKDGRYIAFTSDRNGFTRKIWIIDRKEDSVYQVTHSNAFDYPEMFIDSNLIFISRYRDYGTFAYSVNVKGGEPVKYHYDRVNALDFYNGRLVYMKGSMNSYRFKYRGSADYDIFSKTGDEPVKKVIDNEYQDIFPILTDKGMYFISAPDSIYNIYLLKDNGKTEKITDSKVNINKFSVSRDGRTFVYEKEFRLYRFSAETGIEEEIDIRLSPDFANPVNSIESVRRAVTVSASPEKDSLMLVESNGDIVLYYDGIINKNITSSRYWDSNPYFLKNGKFYFVSNSSGYFNIYLGDTLGNISSVTSDTLAEQILNVREDSLSAYNPEMLYRTQNALFLYSNNKNRKIDDGIIYYAVFSKDGRYIAYSKQNRDGQSYEVYNIYIYDSKDGSVHQLTNTGFTSIPVCFSDDMSRLYFLFKHNIERLEYYGDIYAVDLFKPQPEYKSLEEKEEIAQAIEYNGIEDRIHRITKLKYISRAFYNTGNIIMQTDENDKYKLYKMPLKKTNNVYDLNPEMLCETGELQSYSFNSTGSSLYITAGDALFRIDINSGKKDPVQFMHKSEYNAEEHFTELFDEAWLMLHDNFYDPAFHGNDWNRVHEYYSGFVKQCRIFDELSSVVYRMFGELNASHLGFYEEGSQGSNKYGEPGLVLSEKGGYPVIEEVLPNGAFDKNGINARKGDIILSIDGNDMKGQSMYRFLINKPGEPVKVTLKSGLKNREITFVPENPWTDYSLKYDEVIRRREFITDSVSNNRIAYIHVSAMNNSQYYEFLSRILFKYNDREGLVLDVRDNGGGFSYEYFITYLTRQAHMFKYERNDREQVIPLMRWGKPSIMLINERSFSNAEMFPYVFRLTGIGKLVGTPTAGGVIGTYNTNLSDGTGFRIPRMGVYTLEGKSFENNPVEPDVFIEEIPEDYKYSSDAQLIEAVKQLMEEING